MSRRPSHQHVRGAIGSITRAPLGPRLAAAAALTVAVLPTASVVAQTTGGESETAASTPSADATTDSAAWVILVTGEDGSLRYPSDRFSVVIGSGEDVDIMLGGLQTEHAVLSRGYPSKPYAILPLVNDGTVYLNQDRIDELTPMNTGERAEIGMYAVEAFDPATCARTPRCAEVEPSVPRDPALFQVSLSGADAVYTYPVRGGLVSLGGSDDSDVQHDALVYEHAFLSLSRFSFVVEPIYGTVVVNGIEIEGAAKFGPDDDVFIGDFGLNIVRSTPADAERAAASAVEHRREEFAQPAYEFCHDGSFGSRDPRVAARLCALLDESTAESCPAAQESCPWSKRTREGGWLPQIPIPGGVLEILFIAVLIFAVLWFVVAMSRANWSDDFDPGPIESAPAPLDLQRLPEARGRVLLRQAEDALNAGEGGRAAVLAHLALLRHLDDTGLARYHPSKTNGEYARAIRRHKPLQQLFRRISRQTERIRFGDGQVDVAEVQAVVRDAPAHLDAPSDAERGRVSPPAAATALALTALASSCGGWGGRPYHAHSPEGMAALVALLEASELEVEVGRWKWSDLPPDAGVVVLRTSAAVPPTWPPNLRVDDVLKEASVVVIDDGLLSSRAFHGTRRRPFSIKEATKPYLGPTTAGPCVAPQWAQAQARSVALTDDGSIEVMKPERVITSSVSAHELKMIPLLGAVESSSTGGAAVMWGAHRHGFPSSTCLYLLADRTLFTNASLTRADNAAYVATFFASIAGPTRKVVFVDRLDPRMGSDDDADPSGAGRVFAASNMLPFLLQSLASLVIILFAVGAAFGPLRDTVVQSHKAFIEHVEALGRHYARAGNRGLTHSAHALAKLVVHQNRERIRAGAAGGWRALVRELAAKHDLPEEDVLVALRLGIEGTTELGSASPSDPPPHSDRVLRTLNRLLSGRDAARRIAPKKPVYRRPGSTDPGA